MTRVQYRPEILIGYEEFKVFRAANSNVDFFGDIKSQIKELIKTRNPSVPFSQNKNLLDEYLAEFEKNHKLEEYGCWVYYPWLNQIVQLLPEKEFIEVRTNRNKYKITDEESEMMSKKIVGVVGLSVGQSVAVTMAMERVAGEIRLADFDILELSNYNRIRTVLPNLGLNKAVSVAREISLIDPFIKVKIFTEGLTEDNMDTFFHEGGDLDLLVEASDGLDIKVLSRIKAREVGVPVVMEASDRCIMDIERFDLEPDRPLLHGILGNMSVEKLKNLQTDEEKMAYMIKIGGIKTLSLRMKASMLEVSNSISTWPQLASAVTLGGGVSTDVIRRIFTGEFTDSGRYFVDVAEIVGNKKPSKKSLVYKRDKGSPLTSEEMLSYTRTVEMPDVSTPISMEVLTSIVESAHLAPSGGNCQPWRWLYHHNGLYLFHDTSFSKSYLDYEESASEIAFGAAAENLLIKANELGYNVKYELYPGESKTLVATFSFSLDLTERNNLVGEYDLSKFILDRETNRNIYPTEAIDPNSYSLIRDSLNAIPDAKVYFYKDLEIRRKIGTLLGKIERVRAMNVESHLDFANEVRWTEEENLQTRDGVDIATVDLTEAHKAGYELAMEPDVMELLRKWDKGSGFAELNKIYAEMSDSFGMISLPKDLKNKYFHGGRALERVWLMINGIGLNMQPQSVAVFLFNRLVNEGSSSFGQFSEHMEELYKEYQEIFNLPTNESDIFIFRVFKGEKARVKSLRRDIAEHFQVSSGSING